MKLSGKIYFLEDFDSAIDYRDGTVISLSPPVSYQLGLRGIPYKILEDFYSEEELRSQESSHFQSQLEWIKLWDRFLQSRISFLQQNQFEVARLYYNRIKYFVDPVIIQSYILDQLLSKVGSDAELIYVRQVKGPSPRTMHEFKFSQKSSCFADLLPKICAKHELVRFRILEIRSSDQHLENNSAPSKFNVWGKIKRSTSNWLKPVSLYLKFRKGSSLSSAAAKHSIGVLFLHSGSHHLDPVIRDFLNEKIPTFLVADKKIYSLSKLSGGIDLENQAAPFTQKIQEIRTQANKAANALVQMPHLFTWLRDRTQLDLSDFLIPFFSAFIQETIPEILTRAICLETFIRSHQIGYIVTHTSSDTLSKAAVLATKITRTKSICIQHGCDVFDDPVWLMTDLDPFDFYLAADTLSKNKFTAGALRPFVQHCKVLESPHYLSRLTGARTIDATRKPKKVLYIPTKLSMHGRYFNCMIYPVLWYFEYQKELVKWMAAQKDSHFIFKQGRMIRKYADESIIPFIDDLKASNIQIENGPTTDYFSSVDAVIMDRPSTAFLEATTSGLPVLCLYGQHTANMINAEEKKFFGPSLQPFSNPQEAIERISEFLNSKSRLSYIHDVPLSSDVIAHKIATGQLV